VARKKKHNRKRQKRGQKKNQDRRQRQRQRRSQAPTGSGIDDGFWNDTKPVSKHAPRSLLVPHPERCLPPVYVANGGQVIEDPRTVLGLPTGPLDEQTVRAAWRQALVAHPPEQDPDGARRIHEARDRLVDPKEWLARQLGVLHVPDPEAWDLSSTDPPEATTDRLDAKTRLLGEAVLYALLEAELDHNPQEPAIHGRQQGLF